MNIHVIQKPTLVLSKWTNIFKVSNIFDNGIHINNEALL